MNVPSYSRLEPSGLRAFSAERPLLLLADYPADTPGGGAEIIRSLLDERDQAKIIWVTPTAAGAKPSGAWRGQLTLCGNQETKHQDSILRIGFRSQVAKELSDRLMKLAARENAAGVWIIMHGACVFIAAQFERSHRLPVHLSVHDDPVNFTLLSRRRFFLAPLVGRAFSTALRHATSVDVVSEGMAKAYARHYGIAAPYYHRAVHKPLASVASDADTTELSVGILGNTYGFNNVIALTRATMLAAEQLSIKARLVLIGQPHAVQLKLRFGQAVSIDNLPYAGEGAAVERLAQCTLLYITYPFARLYRTLRQTSFPTKLSTYGLAARPLLLHAPQDSQIMQVAVDQTYALPWTTRRVTDGAEVLSKLWERSRIGQDFRQAAGLLLDTYFDREKNRRILFNCLNTLIERTGTMSTRESS